MRHRVGRFVSVIGGFLLVSACASHAPSVECDKHLAPINVGETLNVPPLHKGTANAGKPQS
jgi:hypothetical protein